MADGKGAARRVIYAPGAGAALLADLAARPDIEACGVLLGTYADGAWRIEDALPLRNTVESATYFEFDPEELLQHDLTWGERIVGAYHSHPDGPPYPSLVDIGNMRSNAASPWVWMILSPHRPTALGALADDAGEGRVEAAAFRVEDGQLVEFPVEVDEEAATAP
jgi:proteasome lid subunit RPN8/RPN11